jgi:hypothetical protein
MALLPRFLGSVSCVETKKLTSIKETIGMESWLSCRRAGTPGPWSKETILLLNKKTTKPQYIVKAGTGEAVESLLRNEANWLRTLRDQISLVDSVPELVTHYSGSDLSFVAECLLSGEVDYRFTDLHTAFLQKLQKFSRQTMRFEESRLCRNLRSRMKGLENQLSEMWLARLQAGMQQIEQAFSGSANAFVSAHNDFTPWNIRVEHGIVKVFDWEYADHEQLPLFDPLHFALMPMALRRVSPSKMILKTYQTLQQCRQWFGESACHEAPGQALAYLMNLCTLYLWSVRGATKSHPVLDRYGMIIDHLCLV